MRDELKLKFTGLYRKLYMLFLVILIPAMMIGGYLFFYAQNAQTDHARKIIRNSMQEAVNSIDNSLVDISVINVILLGDGAVTNLTLSSEGVKINLQEMQQVYALIEKLTLVNPLLTDIAYYTGKDKCVTSFGIFPSRYYFEQLYQYDGYDLDAWTALLTKHRSVYSLPFTTLTTNKIGSVERRAVVPVISVFPIASGRGLLVYTVGINNMLTILNEHMPYDGICFDMRDEQGQSVYSAGGMADQAGFFSQTVVSGINNWTYTVYVPKDSVLSENAPMLLYILLFIGASILVGLVLARFTTNRVYKPLNSINSKLSTGEDAPYSSNLNALEERVEKIIRSNENNASYLKDVVQSYVEALVLSQTMSEKRAATLQSVLRTCLHFQNDMYRCIAVSYPDDAEDTTAQLAALLSQKFAMFSMKFSDRILLIVLDVGYQHNRAHVEECINHYVQGHGQEIIGIAVSDVIANVKEIYRGVNNVLTILQHIEDDDDGMVIFVEDYDIASHYKFTYRDEMQLVEAVQSGKSDELHQLIDGILLENYERHVSNHKITCLIQELNNLCNRMALQENIELDMAEDSQRFLTFEAQRTHLHTLFNQLLSQKKKQPPDSQTLFVKRADEIIRVKYMEDIFVESIAQELGISAKHLSKLYKMENGINLSDQIAMVRVRKVKELLENTDMTVTSIMETTGFTNRATFIRTFKKYVGLTPSSYRSLHSHAQGRA